MCPAALIGALLGPFVAPCARLFADRRPWRPTTLWRAVRSGGPGPVGWACIVLDAGLWGAAMLRWGWTIAGVSYASLFTVLLTVSVLDIIAYRIPDRITYPSMVAAAALVAGGAALSGDTGRPAGAVVGGVLLWAGLGVAHLISPRGMGRGDVKLGAVLGIAVGWAAGGGRRAVGAVLAAFVLACAIGTVVGLVLLVRRRRSAPYPFGPSLVAGAVAVIVASGWVALG